MDIQAYIASGILEAYVAGELDHEEMLAVDKMAEAHQQIKIELEEITKSVQSYGQAQGKLPTRDVLGDAMRQIEEENESVLLTPDFPKEEEIIQKPKWPLYSIAASILLLVSMGFNFYLANQLGKRRTALEDLSLEKSVLADQVESTNQQLDYAKLRIAHFLNDDNIHVKMEGLDISPESFANVFWNKKTNAVFISVDNLPEPPHGHQYQLWAIKPGQAPIDAGIFDHSLLIQELKVIKGDVMAFAVTLEKEGGSPIATVEKTFVKGNLKKS